MSPFELPPTLVRFSLANPVSMAKIPLMSRLNSIELFAGAGGLALGTSRASFVDAFLLKTPHNQDARIKTALR
jgi:hypothetical protein